MEFSTKEIKNIIIAGIVSGFVFSFNEWGIDKFNLSLGMSNLLRATIISLIIYTCHITAQKIIAKKSSCEVEFALVRFQTKKIPIFLKPIGPFLTILISLISNGKLFFIALASFEPIIKRKHRTGHQWTNMKESEEGLIALAGPISNLILVVIFKLLTPLSITFFSKAVFISSALAIFHMLPFPKFDGLKILIGTRYIYVFTAMLTIILIVLINLTSTILASILAFFIATILALLYFYKSNK